MLSDHFESTDFPSSFAQWATAPETGCRSRQLEVRMLIIDEIHSILVGTFREQRILLNAIRFLANDLRIPIVCVGTHDAKQALMTDQQLADRFEAMVLPPWEDDTTFQQLLRSFGAILPLRKSSNLIDTKLRKRVLSLSEGVLVRICRLLECAAVIAIQSGVERIELGCLDDELGTQGLVSISDRRRRSRRRFSFMGRTSVAPRQLPMAPRPLKGELVSSWLSRGGD